MFSEMPEMQTHNRPSFFKYVSASTARLILKNGTLRWSSPVLFNDPFDVTRDFGAEFTEEELNNSLIDQLLELVDGKLVSDSKSLSVITQDLLSGFSAANPETKNELRADLEKHRSRGFLGGNLWEPFREHWRSRIPEHRILCLTEHWDSSSMWNRYADEHRGVVLELACLKEFDSPWNIARPVIYSDEVLETSTAKGFAELMLHEMGYAVRKLLHVHTHTKTLDWSPEREWRIASWKRKYETGLYSDYRFRPEELKSITFGYGIDAKTREDLSNEIRLNYPKVQHWQAFVGNGRKIVREPVRSVVK